LETPIKYARHLTGTIVNLFLLVLLIVATYFVWDGREEIKDIRTSYTEGLKLIQRLEAGLDPLLVRQQAILKYRDFILEINDKMYPGEAYKIASDNWDLSQKYRVDPNLLMALQRQESGYRTDAVSYMGAIGLNQIMPPTGRLLSKALNWSYSDSLLFDSRANTEMACLYLQNAGLTYARNEVILASYNGGFRQAHYYLTKSNRLAEETRIYVTKVMKFYRSFSGSS